MLILALAGCQSTAPSTAPTTPGAPAQPSGPPVLGIDWGRAAFVERPANYEETVAPSYVGMHPILRIQGQAQMSDVAARPGGGFVAIGYAPPDWQPVAWTSPDAQTWTFHAIGTAAFTFPVSLAVGAGGGVVAVGRSGSAPLAWTTTDGSTWQAHDVAVLGAVAERMNAVASGPHGFVAGGSVGPELLDRHARFWTSPDGIDWRPVADDPVAFANAEVRAITGFQGGFVAVGSVGSVQDRTGAVAWVSADGISWSRVDDPAFAGGEAVSVAPGPSGGLIAVGYQVDRRVAVAWTSADGRHWTRAPDEPSREHSGGFAWMTDVVSIGDVAIAVGDVQGLQRGTAISWVSRDGLAWQQAVSAPVQEGAEFYAIAPNGAGALVVGAFGAPDSYVPEVWLTPAR
ncbi:MAG TPA: hypothetical protein VE011_04790 [Candidatus Dormibacteraeota bacterium]|nr:hypothetical protein [Candidatus Dormibacteraeota bacterium]